MSTVVVTPPSLGDAIAQAQAAQSTLASADLAQAQAQTAATAADQALTAAQANDATAVTTFNAAMDTLVAAATAAKR